MIWLVRTAAICLAIATTGSAQTIDLRAFVAQLQRASQSDDRSAVAGMVRYPITISIGGLRMPIADATTFLNRYDDIFNASLRDQIARASVSAGRIIGADDIAIGEAGGVMKITRITVPTYAAPPPAVGNASTPERKSESRRVNIRVGPRPTQIPGLLTGTTDLFVVFVPKGKLVSVRLERVPVGSAALRVVHARNATPLNARASGDGRFVSGRPSEDGEYRIEVRRLATGDDAQLPYMLSLSLR